MHLTPATDADLEAVAALVNSAYRGEAARGGWTYESDYLDGQRTDVAALRADLAAKPGSLILLLRDEPDGPLLANVWLEPAGPDAWYLGLLTVRPDLQARQLGRSLLDESEAFVIARGAKVMRMTVVSIRHTLIAWYERRGYARTGEIEPFPYDDQRFGIPLRDDLSFTVLQKTL